MPSGAQRPRPFVDDSPAWSRDGQSVAFHRGYRSSYGPPGVYLIPSAGGSPVLITRGDLLGPKYLRFSPDGQTLAAEQGGQIVFIDVVSGAVHAPFLTDNGPTYPDWSPDGRLLVHTRLFYQSFPPETPDSAGIHLYDIEAGTDRPLLDPSGESIYGTGPRWSPDGKTIAFIHPTASTSQVCVVRPDGTDLRVLAESQPNALFDYLQWLPGGMDGPLVIFQDSGGRSRKTYAVSPVSGVTRTWPSRLSPWDAFSPDGANVLLLLPQPVDSLGVIFRAQTINPFGLSRRQLTEWLPAQTGP